MYSFIVHVTSALRQIGTFALGCAAKSRQEDIVHMICTQLGTTDQNKK